MSTRTLAATLRTTGPAGTRSVAGRTSHSWRTLLESRWGERLIAVITLSIAYHDAADRPGRGSAGQPGHSPEVGQLMRKVVGARRALSDTEEALGRLSEGRFGRCEQCAAMIPPGQLAREPETRYCPQCASPRAVGRLRARCRTAR
jgi:DnaK suppressor protein